MGEIRLFRLRDDGVEPVIGSTVALEKPLQRLMERHAVALLGIRVLASEFKTTNGGRIDTLGIDESGSPVIIEYKRALNENVISQGLFYLSWLLDHRADFKLLVLEQLGAEVAATIEWGAPRLVCVAGDFTRYDQHAIQQMPRDIDLVRYRHYGDDLLLLELVATSSPDVPPVKPTEGKKGAVGAVPKPGTAIPDPDQTDPPTTDHPWSLQQLDQSSQEVQDWYETLRAYAMGLGDGVHEHVMTRYVAFRGLKNFAYVRFRPTMSKILIDLSLDPSTVEAEVGFVHTLKSNWTRIEIDSDEDVERALPLIAQSYRRT